MLVDENKGCFFIKLIINYLSQEKPLHKKYYDNWRANYSLVQ